MSKLMTPAEINPALAAALGRFSQACTNLERKCEESLYRLIDVTDDMGTVLFAGNQMRRNIELIKTISQLPELNLSPENINKIIELANRAEQANNHRSRILHNPMILGDENKFFIIMHKQDGKGTGAYPITIDFINELSDSMLILCTDFMDFIPRASLDRASWFKSFRSYNEKEYPKQNQPNPKKSLAPKS